MLGSHSPAGSARSRAAMVADLKKMSKRSSRESHAWFWGLPKEERLVLLEDLAEDARNPEEEREAGRNAYAEMKAKHEAKAVA